MSKLLERHNRSSELQVRGNTATLSNFNYENRSIETILRSSTDRVKTPAENIYYVVPNYGVVSNNDNESKIYINNQKEEKDTVSIMLTSQQDNFDKIS